VTRNYALGERQKGIEQNRKRILDAAWQLSEAAEFDLVSVDDIAAEAGVGRATVFRHFGSKTDLYEAALWHRMSQIDLQRLDAAHQLPDPVVALASVLRVNCEMFDQIGDALARCLEVARTDDEMRKLIEISYLGRRVESMSRLARRLGDAGRLAPSWSQSQVTDALLVLTSLEAHVVLTRHRGRPTKQTSDTLFAMAQAFLTEPDY